MNHNLIQMNRYCNDLHDDERIIFCKIDFIKQEFQRINSLKKNVVLIIANGDITFDDNLLNLCPNNVKHIFSTNTTCYNDKVTPIPIGVEMQICAKRLGHGDVNQGIFEKLPYLIGEKIVEESPLEEIIYSNFDIRTNLYLRPTVKNISIKEPHINFEYGITYEKFVKKVQSHLATLSPRGNGIECIRTWEVLYLKSIPIVIGNYLEYKAIYEKIYKNLPIVFIENLNKLSDFNFLKNEINRVKNNSRESLDYSYWVDLIRKKTNQIL